MVIAFDIDGTITRHPAFFALIAGALIDAGHRVIIITFREERAETITDLEEWGVRYSELITWSLEILFDTDVLAWKSSVCREHGVEVFFEDDPLVLAHVDESVVPMLVVDPDFHDLTRTHRED